MGAGGKIAGGIGAVVVVIGIAAVRMGDNVAMMGCRAARTVGDDAIRHAPVLVDDAAEVSVGGGRAMGSRPLLAPDLVDDAGRAAEGAATHVEDVRHADDGTLLDEVVDEATQQVVEEAILSGGSSEDDERR